MLCYFIFVGALAATDALRNVTVTKDKRQVDVQQPTQNFVPSNHQQIGGQHHYNANSEQIAAISPNYYRYVQKLFQDQQKPEQYEDAPKQIAAQHSQQRHNTQPIKQFVYYNEPQVQYQHEVGPQPQLEPKVISEEEYLELLRRQNGESVSNATQPKYQLNKGGHGHGHGQYKTQQKNIQQNHVPQSYLKSYVNPLGEFSLEKELAQLEKSNKAIYPENSEKETEQSLKKERYEFKPSHQFAAYQQDQFLPPDYTQFSGIQPSSQKLISNPYERDESVSEKTNNPPEYQVRYAPSTESQAKYYQEATNTGPKHSFASSPKHQYVAESDHANVNLAKKHSQLIYQKQNQQHAASPSAQQNQKISSHKQPTKAADKLPQFQSSNYNAPSQSSIFVSQSTGVQQKPQQQIQEHQEVQQQQPQHHHQYEHQQPQQHPQRLPPTNPNRPLTQEEFQALVDAGYKVQAIPIPVPVPVSAEAYAQHQAQYQQQHQHPHHLQQSNNPTRHQYQPQPNPSIRPQPSTKHFVRYQQQPTEGVLTSYLRPFLEQYNNLMGGKV